MDPKLQAIFFAHPRSGSTSLFKILQLHPALHLLEEPFNEHFTNWNPHNPNYLAQIYDTASLDTQLAAILTSYNGLKVLDYQLPDELIIHLLHRPTAHVLFLRRRNLLQTVVSNLIAEQTQLWKKWDMTQPLEEYYRHLQPLDIADVERRVEGLQQHLAFCERVIDSRPGIPGLKLVYEDLYFGTAVQRNQQIAGIWQWLEVAALEAEQIQYYLDPTQVKINSVNTYDWVPNAGEIEARCGNAVTGWLYR